MNNDSKAAGILIGYARVSTQDQNLALQQDALAKAHCDRVFTDNASGAKAARPGLTDALSHLRKGDTLVVWKLDRLGRSLKNLIEVTQGLEKRGVGLRSLQEQLDTTTPGGKLVFHVFGALAPTRASRRRVRAGGSAGESRSSWGGRRRRRWPCTAARPCRYRRSARRWESAAPPCTGLSG